jgi:hypothetical protein
MAPARHPDKSSQQERFPTEWAIGGERQTQPSEGLRTKAGVSVSSIEEIGRPVRRETTRPDRELDGAA